MKPIPDKIRFHFFELWEKARDAGLSVAERAEVHTLATEWPALLDQLSASLVIDGELRQDSRLVRDLADALPPVPAGPRRRTDRAPRPRAR